MSPVKVAFGAAQPWQDSLCRFVANKRNKDWGVLAGKTSLEQKCEILFSISWESWTGANTYKYSILDPGET